MQTGNNYPLSEGYQDQLPLKPDCCVVEIPPDTPKDAHIAPEQILGRQVSTFWELKRTAADGPGGWDTVIRSSLTQVLDYAGLIRYYRPFHLFSPGMPVYGMEFVVCYCDAAGICCQ